MYIYRYNVYDVSKYLQYKYYECSILKLIGVGIRTL